MDDTFLSGGKTDVAGIEEGSDAACAVLRLAREASVTALHDDVGLATIAAENLERVRSQTWIGSLAALDAVPYVGVKSFGKLLAFATSHDSYACGVVEVQVLAINDFHGNLEPPSGSAGLISVEGTSGSYVRKAGGVEYLASHVKHLAAERPHTALVSAGDLVGASPLLSALFHDEATIEAMNLMGMALSAVGNHEFDEGVGELLRLQAGGCHPSDGCKGGEAFAGAAFRFLSSNIREQSGGKTLFPPYAIKAFRGARVAFIGATTKSTPAASIPQNIEGLEFRDEAESINAVVPELQDQGIDAIVVLLHEGGKAAAPFDGCKDASGAAFDIAGKLDGAIDAVVTGHTNAAHVCDTGGKLVTSAASNGRLVTQLVLAIDERTGKLVSRTATNRIVTRDVAPDADQTALLDRYRAVAAPLANRVVGQISANLTRAANAAGESALGDVIADAQLAATAAPDKGGAQVAFMNPYGIRTDLLVSQCSGGEAPGEVTHAEAFAVQPFGNILVTLTLTGAQLDALLEQQWTAQGQMVLSVSQGFSYTWSASAPIGDRVSDLRVAGILVDPAQEIRVTVNVFVAEGGDGFTVARQGTSRTAGVDDLEALESYLASQSPLAAPQTNRITRNP